MEVIQTKKLLIPMIVALLVCGLVFGSPVLAKGKLDFYNKIPAFVMPAGKAVLVSSKAVDNSPVIKCADGIIETKDGFVFFILSYDYDNIDSSDLSGELEFKLVQSVEIVYPPYPTDFMWFSMDDITAEELEASLWEPEFGMMTNVDAYTSGR